MAADSQCCYNISYLARKIQNKNRRPGMKLSNKHTLYILLQRDPFWNNKDRSMKNVKRSIKLCPERSCLI